jgi:hypothetical protein
VAFVLTPNISRASHGRNERRRRARTRENLMLVQR